MRVFFGDCLITTVSSNHQQVAPMNKRLVLILILVFPLLFQCRLLPPRATSPGPNLPATRILFQAKKILVNIESTHYSHRTSVDEDTGLYVFDCSALVCHILERAAPLALAAVTIDPGHSHARAKNFYDTFVNASTTPLKGDWQRIKRLVDAAPGDLIAWRKDPLLPKGNTGHVVIVMESPERDTDGSIRVVVMDASHSGHGADTRPKKTDGVGSGTMWFRTKDDGAPVSFHWSSLKRPARSAPIAIGRVIGPD